MPISDLDSLSNADSVVITGPDKVTGAKVSLNGDLQNADTLNNGGTQGVISVGTSPVPVRVGASNLANRKILSADNDGTATLYWGYTNSVTPSTGTRFYRNQTLVWAAGSNTTIWLVAASGTHTVRVTEGA